MLVLLAAGAGLWWFVASFKARVQTEKSQAQPSLVELRSGERRLMGTTAEIILFAPDEETGRAAIEKAFARAEEINDICSDYSPESELMRLCREPVNKPIAVSETLAEVLTHARTIAELTEGAFDPTLGGYSKLWRKSKRKKELPDPILLERARQSSGWEKFEVDLENFTVVIKDENLLLDLGGIAKGYAADEMLRVINGHGITSAMVTARVAGYLNPRYDDQNIGLDRSLGGPRVLSRPNAVMRRLNERFIADPGIDEYLTMAYATVDLATGVLCLVQAGHRVVIWEKGSIASNVERSPSR